MFTGIIEKTGIVKEISKSGTNKSFWVESPISGELQADQSICHDGVCLTVETLLEGMHRVTAISETLQKTSLGTWKAGRVVNLERAILPLSRLDGHIVQGHVDATGLCTGRKDRKGSWEYHIEFPKEFAGLVIEKGSVCLNGISLTAFSVRKKSFTVAIIPYTFEHTNMKLLFSGMPLNIEFDLIGKYIARQINLQSFKKH